MLNYKLVRNEKNKKDSEDYAVVKQEYIQMPTRKEILTEEEYQNMVAEMNKDPEYGYELFNRQRNFATFYLGFGNRNPKNLWGRSPEKHIALMKVIYDNLSPKPLEFSFEQLKELAEKMGVEIKEEVQKMDLQTAIANEDYMVVKQEYIPMPTIEKIFTEKEYQEMVTKFNENPEKAEKLLFRLASSAIFYLRFGKQYLKNLWGFSPEDHIAYMKVIYDNLSPKPEGFPFELLKELAEKMGVEIKEEVQKREEILTEEEYQEMVKKFNENPEEAEKLLFRLKSSAIFYLKFDKQYPKNLWGKSPEKHIAYMKFIYDNLSPKPEWLSLEQLKELAEKMGVEIKEEVQKMDLQTAIANKDYKFLKEHLEKGIESYLDSETYKKFLSCFSSFNDYSQKNMRLLLAQMPTATMVAKASDWKNLGRYPSKGTKALRVYAPVPEYKKDEEGNYLKDEKGNKISTGNIAGWKFVPVFDVSQTNGKELPKPIYELTENFKEPKHFLSIFNAVKKCTTASISLQEISQQERKGFYNPQTHSIVIRKGMNQYQTLKTEIHEVAHSILHQKSSEFISKEQKEFEAESVAYIVCKNYGVDTSDYSFAYLSSWTNKGERIADFENSLKTITNTARDLIKKIDKELYQELTIKENKVEEHTNKFSIRLQDAQRQLGNTSEKSVTQTKENANIKK